MDRKLCVLDLFSGIGGFSLGLERSGGFETVAFCEIEDYPRRVLAKHWPGVPIYNDVRTLTADTLRRDGIAVDVICGGFPCQDLSFAGRRAGLQGERSGLWGEYRRLIGELRPRFVIVENVPGLLSLGMGTVLGDLAALGCDATWHCIPASAVGAPHRRDRVWIIAYANGAAVRKQSISERRREGQAIIGHHCEIPNANGNSQHDGPIHAEMAIAPELVANADKHGQSGQQWQDEAWKASAACGCGEDVPNASREKLQDDQGRSKSTKRDRNGAFDGSRWTNGRADIWRAEPDVGRVVDGVSKRVDRLRCLGNAVVPQIPEIIGRAIIKSLNEQKDNAWTA